MKVHLLLRVKQWGKRDYLTWLLSVNLQQPQLSKKEIEDLLKKGAYGAIMEDDGTGDQFCEEDIDQILQRRTQVVQIEAGVKGGTFAKASFSASSSRSDISLDDPEFWNKWAKKADLDIDEMKNRVRTIILACRLSCLLCQWTLWQRAIPLSSLQNELIIEMPRQRKQTSRYGNQDSILNMSDLDTSDSDADEDGTGDVKEREEDGQDGERWSEDPR